MAAHNLPLISVIIPVFTTNDRLDNIRKSFVLDTVPIEVIIVVSKDLRGKIVKQYPFEKIIVSKTRGRGFACSRGIQIAKGEIIIILHADTILPDHWHTLITNTLNDISIVGGAFSLAFDSNHKYLKLLIFISDMFFKMTRELWGDRAIFFRTQILKDYPQLLDVPIMEDVKLSGLMKKKGVVIKLREKVITSSGNFIKNGFLRHSYRIMLCRIWYALGGNLEKIYCYYYSK